VHNAQVTVQKSENLPPAGTDLPTGVVPHHGSSIAEAVRAIVRRVAGREDELATRVVDRCREEIVDYRAGDKTLHVDATRAALDNVEVLLSNLEHGEAISTQQLEKTRMGAARRVHQCIPLVSYLRAMRLWGEVTWETLRAAARDDSPEELEAALEIAGRVMRHVDAASTAGALAYLHEAQGLSSLGQVLRRDLLEALLGGERETNAARRRAQTLGIRLAENHVVLVIRQQEVPSGGGGVPALATRSGVLQAVETARTYLRSPHGTVLVGVRETEVIALYPVEDATEIHTVRVDADSLARALGPSRLSVGMSGWQPGLAAVALSYAEAKEAAQIAAAGGITGRAVTLDEVLVDHIARYTPYAGRVLDDTLHPLIRYDSLHGTSLVQTISAYIDSGFNLTRSSEVLHVHPNTVMYRLRRVGELSGRDPHDPDDLLILFLALKLAQLNPPP
jgi:sugar diacid utilization regulator